MWHGTTERRAAAARCAFALWAALSLGLSAAWATETRRADESAVAGVAEIAPRAARALERYGQLQKEIGGYLDAASIEGAARAAETEARTLAEALAAAGRSGAPYDRVAELQSAARAAGEPLDATAQNLAKALDRLAADEKSWREEKAWWENRAAALPPGAAAAAPRAAVGEAQATTEAALSLVAREALRLASLQQRVASAREALKGLDTQAGARMDRLRADLLAPSGPSFLSPAFYVQLRAVAWTKLAAPPRALPDAAFLASSGWVAVLQLLLFAATASQLRRYGEVLGGSPRWQFLTHRPLSAAVFVGVAVPAPLYGVTPAVWQLGLWGVAGTAAARLVGALVSLRWKRRLLYLLAAVFLASQAMRAVEAPEPILRLYAAVVAAAGLPLTLWRARASMARRDHPLYTASLRAGATVFGVVLLAQAGGYHALALYLLEAAIETTFLVLMTWMAAMLVRGAVEFLLGPGFAGKFPPVAAHGHALAVRLGWLVDAAAALGGTSLVLSVWRLYESPAAALRGIFSLGLTLGESRLTVGVLVAAGAALAAALAASWTIRAALEGAGPAARLDAGLRLTVGRLAHYALVLLGLFLALGALGVDVRNLTILVSAFGIGIGFGLQNVVNNFVSGLILLFERPIKVGDVVQVAGEWGEVKSVGLRSTVIQTFDRSEVIVPNSDLISNPLTNWTLSDRQSRLVVQVGVAYGSDVERVLGILKDAAEGHPLVLADPAPQVLFARFGESSLDFELRVWTSDVTNRPQLQSDLHRAVERNLREAAVEIPFPQRDLHLRSVAPDAARSLAADPAPR